MALFSAFCFAASTTTTRRGVMRIKDVSLGGYVSVFVAPPLFLLVALILGDLPSIAAFTWKGYLWLGIAGIIHFVIGRSSNYWSVKYLGANMASIFTAANIIYVILLGYFVLGEHITRNMALGSLLIMVGPALLAWPQKGGDPGAGDQTASKPRLSRKGIIAGLLTGLFFGISPLFIKWGLAEGGSALAGTFISYSSAMFILGMSMVSTTRRDSVFHMERQAVVWFILSGLFTALAQISRYTALKLTPISIVGPLIATNTVFLLVLSFVINRKTESFRLNVIIGALLVVVGAALVYQ
ncbi:MAG: EamA family transporter [Syntrophales bacterium]